MPTRLTCFPWQALVLLADIRVWRWRCETSTGALPSSETSEKWTWKSSFLSAEGWCGYEGAPVVCVQNPSSTLLMARQQHHNSGDPPSRQMITEHLVKCPEFMSTRRALPSTWTLVLLRKFPFPISLAHPFLSQAFLCSPLSSAGEVFTASCSCRCSAVEWHFKKAVPEG